jgi:hypothetical protein
VFDGFKDCHSHPTRRRPQRSTPIFRHKRQTARSRKLDNGSFSIPKEDPIRNLWQAKWPWCQYWKCTPASRLCKDVSRSFTAIRDWDARDQIRWPE